jgi:hypothetical protein
MMDEKLDLLLVKTTRIETALWPDDGQPGILTRHESRMDEIEEKIKELNGWKNRLIGAWGIVTTFFGIHVIGKHGG